MSKSQKNIRDLNIDLKTTRFKKASFSSGIIDIEENKWSNWVVSGNKKTKIKWNWLNDENNVIMQIHDKQALPDEKNPDDNYVYYVHLQNMLRDSKGYDFEIKEKKFTNLSPERKLQLLKEVNQEMGLPGNYDNFKNDTNRYLLIRMLPALELINQLGIELTESNFYEIKDISILPETEVRAGIKCFGILPETLSKVNKFHAPYTYFFDEIDKNYLINAVGFINTYSSQLAQKSHKKFNSFNEKLFFLSHIFADIDRAYNNSEVEISKQEPSHKIKKYFKYDKNRLLEIGMKMFDAKKYNVSIEYLTKAVKQDPFFEQAWFKLGESFLLEHEWDKAMTALNKAIDLVPQNPKSYYCRGGVFLVKKRYTSAYNDLQQAILLDYEDPGSHSMLAVICIETNNYTEALEHYENAIKLSVRKKDIYLVRRSALYFKMALYEECLADCNTALELNIGNRDAMKMKNKCQSMLNN